MLIIIPVTVVVNNFFRKGVIQIKIKIGNTIIGDGTVKICMPVSAQNMDELAEELDYVAASACDIVEVRYDYWNESKLGVQYPEALLYKIERTLIERTIQPLAESANENNSGKRLLLFTYRTGFEGGLGSNEDDEYNTINTKAIRSGHIDIIDIEFTKEPGLIGALIEQAHKYNVKVIVSKHFFNQKLSRYEILETLLKMQDTNADIIKLAVSVYDDAGAQDVILAAKEMYEKYAKKPFVTIGMGEHGKVTRYIEPFYGSSITYAKGPRATAPGQLDISELRTCSNASNAV